jgi:prophage regulatory protein
MTNRKHKTFLRKPDVQKRTGLSDTTIWRLEQVGKFPVRVQLTEKIVGWDEDEILAHQQALLDARRKSVPQSAAQLLNKSPNKNDRGPS